MRNLFIKLFGATALLCAAASCYDDTSLWEAVNTNKVKIEALEKLVNQINQDVSEIKIMLAALKEKDFVVEVYDLPDDAGFIILFDSGKSLTIRNGKDGKDGDNGKDGEDGKDGKDGENGKDGEDGKDGKDGENGKNGKDGKDGKDGSTPVISVAKGSDGYWYWTINGSWLLDSQGNKVRAEGKDAVTPKFKIEDGYWFVSYDNGGSWEKLGKATGEDGDTLFRSVTEDEDNLYITMANGDVFTFPKKKDFRVVVNNTEPIKLLSGQKIEVPYTLENVGKEIEFTTLCEGAWIAKIVKKDAVSGHIAITAPDPYTDGKVVLLACSDGVSSMKVLTFEEGYYSVSGEATSINVSGDGGSYSVTFTTNLDLSFSIWDDCKSWVEEIKTKSEQVTAVITVAENETSEERVGHISVFAGDIKLSDLTLIQAKAPEFVDLGLSVKWRKYNVGATKSYEFGNYFAWGEVAQKDSYYYYWSNYKYCKGSETTITKYVTRESNGTVDNKVILEPEDDAAQVNLGDGWRMPTFEEFQELRDNCDWEWTEDYNGTGIKGRIVKSLVPGYTNRSIFLPAAGCCTDESSVMYYNRWGQYYSSSLNVSNNYGANGFVFYDSSTDGYYGAQCMNFDLSRYLGKTIRPVRDFETSEKTVFQLYKTSEAFDPKTQKYAVSLLSNVGGRCDLSNVSSWVTLLSQQGNTFLFEIAKNKTGAERKGNIVFRSDDGAKSCNLAISQESSSEIDATSLKLSFTNTSGTMGGYLYIGKSYGFNVTATPSNATTHYEWKVENTDIATISGSGSAATLSTKNYGKTRVIVTETNSGLSASYDFGTCVTNFQFTENTGETYSGYPKITMVVGEQHKIQYSCSPSSATNVFSDLNAFNFKEVKSGMYVIVNESSVVNVEPNGLMTAKAVGKTIIESNNGAGVCKASGGVDGIYVQVLSEYTETEPNNDFPYANQLKMGVPMSFYISTTTDADVFQYSANKTSISFDLTYTGDGSSTTKHLRWELYDSSCNLRGSGTLSLGASGDVITMTNKLVGTSSGYLKFYFPTNWYSYPETRPSDKLTIKVY